MNRFIVGDAIKILHRDFVEGSIDLTVTSPPYEDLRTYKGFSFDAEKMLQAIYRVTKDGGVCVWVVGDKINGGRSLVSFNHAFMARQAGFVVHDIMIYQKKNTPFMRSNAYTNSYEFMFVFAKGKPKTFNPLKVPTARHGWERSVSNKGPDAVNRKVPVELKKEKVRTNIWPYAVGLGGSTKDRIAFKHPAVFPEKLAEDHILSWSGGGISCSTPCADQERPARWPNSTGANGLELMSLKSISISRSNAWHCWPAREQGRRGSVGLLPAGRGVST